MSYYSAFVHNLVKAFGDIDYPITKAELIAKVGDKGVQNDFNSTISLKKLIEELPVDRFTCACELYCNIDCVVLKFD